MPKETQNFAVFEGFFRWKPAAWLRVTGADSFSFLQGQISNDLRGMKPGSAVYGLWLNHKGRVLADSFVVRAGEEDFWLGSYFSSAATLRERLEAYIIADDVSIEDETGLWEGITLLGTSTPPAPAGAVSFAGRRGGAPSLEMVFPAKCRAEMETLVAGERALEAGKMERRRIVAGVPSVPSDIGPNDLPHEGGLDAEAVSYTKGCYLGQEVMARLKSMGQVRRRLMRVRGEGGEPATPVELFQGERKIGELRSVAADGDGFVGHALVTLLNFRADTPLTFSTGGGPVRAVEVLT